MKDEGADTDDIDKAIDLIDKELEDTKSDFLKYQKDADKGCAVGGEAWESVGHFQGRGYSGGWTPSFRRLS